MATEQLVLQLDDVDVCPSCKQMWNAKDIWNMGACYPCFLVSVGATVPASAYDQPTQMGMTLSDAILTVQDMEKAGPSEVGKAYVLEYEYYLAVHAAAGLGVPQRYVASRYHPRM